MTNLAMQIRSLKNNDPEAGEETRGWNAAIDAVLELLPVDDWIKCSDRMPDPEKTTWVWAAFPHPSHPWASTMHWTGTMWTHEDGSPITEEPQPTHWQLLPALPEELRPLA